MSSIVSSNSRFHVRMYVVTWKLCSPELFNILSDEVLEAMALA